MIKINLNASFRWHHRYRPSTSLKIIPIILTFYLSIYLHLTTFQLDSLLTHSNYFTSINNSKDWHIQYSQTHTYLYYCLCLCISFISSAILEAQKQTPPLWSMITKINKHKVLTLNFFASSAVLLCSYKSWEWWFINDWIGLILNRLINEKNRIEWQVLNSMPYFSIKINNLTFGEYVLKLNYLFFSRYLKI